MYKVLAGLGGLPDALLKHTLAEHLEDNDIGCMAGVSKRLNQLFAEKASAAKKAKIEALVSDFKYSVLLPEGKNRTDIIKKLVGMQAIPEAKKLIESLYWVTECELSEILIAFMENLPAGSWSDNEAKPSDEVKWMMSQIGRIKPYNESFKKHKLNAMITLMKCLPKNLWKANAWRFKEEMRGLGSDNYIDQLIHAFLMHKPGEIEETFETLEDYILQS